MMDAEELADRPGALAGFQPAPGFLTLNLGEFGLTSKLHAAGLSSRQAALTAGKNAQALILCHGTQEGYKAPPKRCREVQVRLVEHLEEAAAVGDALDDLDAIDHRSSGTIPLSHDEHIAGASMSMDFSSSGRFLVDLPLAFSR